VLRLTRDAAEV